MGVGVQGGVLHNATIPLKELDFGCCTLKFYTEKIEISSITEDGEYLGVEEMKRINSAVLQYINDAIKLTAQAVNSTEDPKKRLEAVKRLKNFFSNIGVTAKIVMKDNTNSPSNPNVGLTTPPGPGLNDIDINIDIDLPSIGGVGGSTTQGGAKKVVILSPENAVLKVGDAFNACIVQGDCEASSIGPNTVPSK